MASNCLEDIVVLMKDRGRHLQKESFIHTALVQSVPEELIETCYNTFMQSQQNQDPEPLSSSSSSSSEKLPKSSVIEIPSETAPVPAEPFSPSSFGGSSEDENFTIVSCR